MKRKILYTLLIIASLIGANAIIQANDEVTFNRMLSEVQRMAILKMNNKKTVSFHHNDIDTIFAKNTNKKVMLFIPYTYSKNKATETLSIIDSILVLDTTSNKYWILTNHKRPYPEKLISSKVFSNNFNWSGFGFKTAIGNEQMVLFTLDYKQELHNVLWDTEMNTHSLSKYFQEINTYKSH